METRSLAVCCSSPRTPSKDRSFIVKLQTQGDAIRIKRVVPLMSHQLFVGDVKGPGFWAQIWTLHVNRLLSLDRITRAENAKGTLGSQRTKGNQDIFSFPEVYSYGCRLSA